MEAGGGGPFLDEGIEGKITGPEGEYNGIWVSWEISSPWLLWLQTPWELAPECNEGEGASGSLLQPALPVLEPLCRFVREVTYSTKPVVTLKRNSLQCPLPRTQKLQNFPQNVNLRKKPGMQCLETGETLRHRMHPSWKLFSSQERAGKATR